MKGSVLKDLTDAERAKLKGLNPEEMTLLQYGTNKEIREKHPSLAHSPVKCEIDPFGGWWVAKVGITEFSERSDLDRQINQASREKWEKVKEKFGIKEDDKAKAKLYQIVLDEFRGSLSEF